MVEDEKLTPEVLEKIEELRKRARAEQLLSDVYDTNWNLYRWLLGWRMDVEKAYTALRRHLMVRRAFGLDSCPPPIALPVIRKFLPISFVGSTGKSNSVFLVDMLGQYDPHAMVHAVPSGQALLDRMYFYERVLREIMRIEAKTGKRGFCTVINDFTDFVFDSSALPLITGPFCETLRYLWDNYPELTDVVLNVNVPELFSTLYKAVKPFIPERTREKQEVGNAQILTQQYIAPERLPIQYGGTMVDDNGDPHCSQWIVTCKKPIPKEYWNYREYDGTAIEKMTAAKIRKGNALFIPYTCSGSTSGLTALRLDFISDSIITYSILYCTNVCEVFFREKHCIASAQ